MSINPAMRLVLKALSFDGIEVESERHMADLKRLDPMKIFYKTADVHVYNGEYEVPIRLFFPDEGTKTAYEEDKLRFPKLLLLFHGGGWVTNCVDNYERICARLSISTGNIVAAVEYRLAPEYKFPAGLLDCYAAAEALFRRHKELGLNPDDITLIGDSAGGNLAAAVSLMARDKGEFLPKRQILIYPAVYNDYSENSPFLSVRENGTEYLLTAGKMQDYIALYAESEADMQNPYFAPYLAEDLSNQPDTLILTAEFDPLRDEGEAYGQRLMAAGNLVEIHRIKDALHGYFSLGIKYFHVQESFDHINAFLGGSHGEAETGTLEKIRQRRKAVFGSEHKE
ncbi:alpha/beta hydrolase [Mediterraneibacter agrestimuris]|uniref:alpha/beta hydrolase n=1 Tax=Mediterraneibacter agrestimuris TaxID=2941333 RepID=UPI00203B6C12|nr:alpha/beta hydrolase [Mediterraneibacter agrestimuris]